MKFHILAATAVLALAPVAASAVTTVSINLTQRVDPLDPTPLTPSLPLLDNASKQDGTNLAGVAYAPIGSYGAFLPTGATWLPGGDPTVTPPPGSIIGFDQSPFNNDVVDALPCAPGCGNPANLPAATYFSAGPAGAGANGGTFSPATVTFAAPLTSIEILWGSIDNYNTIEFFSGATSVGTFGGATAYGLTTLTPDNATNSEIVALFQFVADPGTSFDKIKFSSTTQAIEFAFGKDSFSVVPAPFGAALLVTALVGAGVFSRRRKAEAA